jgi:hypothetical protein
MIVDVSNFIQTPSNITPIFATSGPQLAAGLLAGLEETIVTKKHLADMSDRNQRIFVSTSRSDVYLAPI